MSKNKTYYGICMSQNKTYLRVTKYFKFTKNKNVKTKNKKIIKQKNEFVSILVGGINELKRNNFLKNNL